MLYQFNCGALTVRRGERRRRKKEITINQSSGKLFLLGMVKKVPPRLGMNSQCPSYPGHQNEL